MKLIIAGSRSLNTYSLIEKAIQYASTCENPLVQKEISMVVHGGAKGIDSLAGIWAANNKIKVKVFEAKWKDIKVKDAVVRKNQYGQYNARAGFQRNEKMAKYGEALLAIIQSGGSSGTEHMIVEAQKQDLPVWVYEV